MAAVVTSRILAPYTPIEVQLMHLHVPGLEVKRTVEVRLVDRNGENFVIELTEREARDLIGSLAVAVSK